MKKIAVYDNFTEPKHRQQIDATAAKYGFTVDYYAVPETVPAGRWWPPHRRRGAPSPTA